jgi:hypothetical protein
MLLRLAPLLSKQSEYNLRHLSHIVATTAVARTFAAKISKNMSVFQTKA